MSEQEFVDPFPKLDRFVIGNKIRVSARIVLQSIEGRFGAEVSIDDVVDVAEIYAIVARPDNSQFALSTSFEDARDEVRVARTPNEVGGVGRRFSSFLAAGNEP